VLAERRNLLLDRRGAACRHQHLEHLSLVDLAIDSERIKNFDFSGEMKPVSSILYEVNALGEAQAVMKGTLRERTQLLTVAEQKLASLVESGILLSRERDRDKLLRHILFSGKELSNCDAGTMYLKTDDRTLRFALRTNEGLGIPRMELPLYDPAGKPIENFASGYVALHGKTVNIEDVYAETRFDMSGTKRFAEESGYKTVSMITIPLSPREGEVTARRNAASSSGLATSRSQAIASLTSPRSRNAVPPLRW